MDQRRAAGALLALAVCIASTAAAPTVSDQTGIDLYEGSTEGCYYNFQHYGEGDRIMTNEPCLNCTCHNRMLMCYLRVCPFTKPIGQDCTVEKRADQCCPIVTCPDVPVDLLTSTSTTSPAEYGGTGVGKLDKYGCSINGKYFPEGSKVPPSPNKPCEHCYCIRNMTTCVMQECTLHVDGCTPIYHKDVCCPVRYSCDHPEDTTLLLDDMTTTVRPTPGFLLTTTTISPVTQMSQDCVHDDQIFSDGALIKTEKACEHCYCMKGDIVCVVQECGTPMENEGKNCTSQPPREGQCCPDTYICEGDEVTTELPSDYTTQPLLEELTTTLAPPRRIVVEGSGYRKETEQPAETEAPTMEAEPEGSGYEEQTEPATFDEKEITSETPEIGTETIDESPYSSRTTVRTPTLEEVEKTTEPDKGLNTVPSDASDEDMYKPSITEKTPYEEPKVTETAQTEDKTPVNSEDKTTSSEDQFTPVVTSKSEESSSTTESTFRKEDELAETTEIDDLVEPEKVTTQATDIEKETEEDETSSKTKAPFMEELEKQTTSSPVFTQKDIEEIPSKESTTESVLKETTPAYAKPTESGVEPSETESTKPTKEKDEVPETTSSDQNEIEDISTTLPPARIPGEGDCLLNDITYRNNSNVPSTNNCHTGCRCVSSIIKCDPIICSPPPEYMDNCQPTYDSPDSCCPTYVCHTGETMPPQPHSQMSGTDSPLPSPPVECHGDECEIRKDDNVPVIGDCGSAGCGEGQEISKTQPGSCQDGKCSYPAQPCADGNCQETPTPDCENGKCGIEPEIVPVKIKPLCENESECKVTVPEVPPCEGEACVNVNVGCTGSECSLDDSKPIIPKQDEEDCKDDCKTPAGETDELCAQMPCRRKESGEVDTSIPTECSGSECIQQVPSKEDEINIPITASPVTEGTSAKSTQALEMTTRASEDASGYGPTETVEHALEEGSTSGPLHQATEEPEDKYTGTAPSSESSHTTESQFVKEITKTPQIFDEDLSTSKPEIFVTGAVSEGADVQSAVTESQDTATKVTAVESLESSTTLHAESPHDTDDIRTAGPQEYTTNSPEIKDTKTESPEHHEAPEQETESSLSLEPEKTNVDDIVTDETVPYTPETGISSTKLPDSYVKEDAVESDATQVTESSHDVTELNEVVDKATTVPELVDSDEHKLTTEMFMHDVTTEAAMLITETSHTEKELEQAPFTNAPTEPHLDDKSSVTETITEKISEVSTAKVAEDVSSETPETYNTEKQDHFTESPEEHITEPQEASTKQPALESQEPQTTDERIDVTKEPTLEEDMKSQTTPATTATDLKIKDDELPSDIGPMQESTTQATESEDKTIISEPAEKQPTESFEAVGTTQSPSDKPADTESLDTLTTKQPSKIPLFDDSTDEPAVQEITEQPEISTEEPAVEVESPVTDKIPSEPFIPVHPETTPELGSTQPDILNEIPDSEPDTQSPISDKDVEAETKIPERAGSKDTTEEPESMDTESPEVKVPDTVTKEAATESPEVHSESPEVTKDEEIQPTDKPLETEAPTVDEIPDKAPETYVTEKEVKDSVTTEKIREQSSENEQTSEPEKYSTVSIVQDTTVAPVAQQESSEHSTEPEVTESDISYATMAPESHIKEPQQPVTETAEAFTTESYIGVSVTQEKLTPDETVTEDSQDKPSEETPSDEKAEERPVEKPEEKPVEKPEEKPEITQEEVSTRRPEEASADSATEAAQDISSTKPQEAQEEDKEDSGVTEPTVYKTTESYVNAVTSADGQEKITTDGPLTQDITPSQDSEMPEKYTAATDAPIKQETSSPHEESTEKPVEEEDVEKQPTTLKTPMIEMETLPDQAIDENTKEPSLYATQGPGITEKESYSPSSSTESPYDEQTTPEIVELEEHSHKPLEEVSTVAPTEEEIITNLPEEHTDEEKQKPLVTTEEPEASTASGEEKISTPSSETKVPVMDLEEVPIQSTLAPSGEGEQESVIPTTSQPNIQVGDTRFGEDTSAETPESTKAGPEAEQSPVSVTEIPEQTERVPSEKVTEPEFSHETVMLEEVSPVTTKQEEAEGPTEKPEYVQEGPLEEKPQEEASVKPLEESSEKPTDEITEKPMKESEQTPLEGTEPAEKPSKEMGEKPTESPLAEPVETPEPKPLEEEALTETPQTATEGVTMETPLEESDKTPEEKPEQKPLDESDKMPAEQPTETPSEATEQPEVKPVEESEDKTTDTPVEPTEKPQEVEETPSEPSEEKPLITPEDKPLETPEEKPVETPEEKPVEAHEEQPTETPEEKPLEIPEEKPVESPEEKPVETTEKQPEEKPVEKPEEKPAEAPEEKPTETPEEKPVESPEEKPVETTEKQPEEKPVEKPEEKPAEAPEEKPTETPEEKPVEMPEEKPVEAPEERPTETPEEKPVEAPEEQPTETPEEKPVEAPEEQPTETPEEKPVVTPEEKPVEAPEEKPVEAPEEQLTETPEEKPLESPEEKTTEAPQKAPVEKTEEKPLETPEEKPLETPEEKPVETPEETPMESPEEKPVETPEEKPLESPEESPVETTEKQSMETPQETPEQKPEEVSEQKPQEQPEDKLEEKPQEVPDQKPEDIPQEKPQEQPEEKPQEVPEEKPQETPEEKPQETAEEKPQETPEEKPQELPEVPEEKPQELPEEKPQELPKEKPEEKPQDEPQQKPQEVPEEKPAEPASTASPETPRPSFADMQPTDEVPDDDSQFPPSGGTSGYGTEPDYVEEDQAFGPGTCRYGGKVYVSAQQIPRDDPCDFCFCFRSDIICLQQSCPPPIHGCHEEPIQGFCCPRYECPVAMATTLNVTTTTTTTTTTLPPHFLPHAYKGAAQRRGCQIKGHTYKVGEVVRASSGPCLHCTCGGDGQMKCDPKACTPEPMLRQMIAAAVSAKRRR